MPLSGTGSQIAALEVGVAVGLQKEKFIGHRPPSRGSGSPTKIDNRKKGTLSGGGFPTEIDYRQKVGTLILTSLLEDLVKHVVGLPQRRLVRSSPEQGTLKTWLCFCLGVPLFCGFQGSRKYNSVLGGRGGGVP